ncbi:MAG: hypothetical protein AAFU70_14205 [Planctomycetota bacterium]
MKLTLRDEMATRIAAALADSSLTPEEVAMRAYATADALSAEREKAPLQMSFGWHEEEVLDGPTELFGFSEATIDADPGPKHDPAWETSPRWSREDRAAADAQQLDGPGIASARPKSTQATPEEEQADVG